VTDCPRSLQQRAQQRKGRKKHKRQKKLFQFAENALNFTKHTSVSKALRLFTTREIFNDIYNKTFSALL
jgi:hypothetical protein